MKIIEWDKLEIEPTPHGVDVRKLYDTEHAQLMHITLKHSSFLFISLI